jgi:hypothetical protein
MDLVTVFADRTDSGEFSPPCSRGGGGRCVCVCVCVRAAGKLMTNVASVGLSRLSFNSRLTVVCNVPKHETAFINPTYILLLSSDQLQNSKTQCAMRNAGWHTTEWLQTVCRQSSLPVGLGAYVNVDGRVVENFDNTVFLQQLRSSLNWFPLHGYL